MTHIFNRPLELKTWVPVYFYSQNGTPEKGDGSFFLGLENYDVTHDEIEARVQTGEVTKLRKPLPIRSGQGVWQNPKGELMVATHSELLDHIQFQARTPLEPA